MFDAAYIDAAIALARRGLGHVRPNPPVGALVVLGGRVVGEGWHRRAGGDHAEVAAIKDALGRGFPDLSGAELYVTLEPCSRAGRVGACTDAIAASGIRRVWYAVHDPNPTNAGKADDVLRARGIDCSCAEEMCPPATRAAARDLVRFFAKHVATGLPYVVVKIAMSLDGRICDDYGDARWVSSAAARERTGKMREEMDAIMVGGETVRKDNPSLLSHGERNDDLVRVVVSRSGDLPANAQVFTDGAPNETLVFGDGAEALRELGRRGLTSVLCEGGLRLATSLAEAGLVDEWITVLAPKVIGSRRIAESVTIGRCSCLPG